VVLVQWGETLVDFMLQLISAPVAAPDAGLHVVEVRVERRTLMKRLWRGTAADGVEFGFELGAPLKHGDTVWQTDAARYVIVQEAEPVLEVLIGELPASATAGIGWAVGNLHLEFSSEAERLLTPDEPAARQLLARIQINFNPTMAVFRPGRFKRSVDKPIVDELGPSHKH
jgi:urease accessory protein